jgi:putative acetyltransferase
MLAIRPELPSDHEAVYRVHEQAFGRMVEADLAQRVRETLEFIPELSLVAERDGEVVGHVMFSVAWVVDGEARTEVIAVGPVGVLPGHQRRGIGSRLVEAGVARARELGYRAVLLLGHPEYYPRFGFRPAEEFGILPPWGEPTPALMALPLVPDGLAGVRGALRYCSAFDGAE